MSPTPILPYPINLILHYISPPSQLNDTIPPHILSRSLLQRHRFLGITPDDPANYLCWPSSNRDRTMNLLESLPKSLDDPSSSDLRVQYLSDIEHTYAHAHVSSTNESDGLRLVFQWEPSDDSWKYHDAGLMPFPSTSCPSLKDALAMTGASDRIPYEANSSSHATPGESDDDDYWNSYANRADGDDSELDGHLVARHSGSEVGDDAYWAQYASIQGSADSTIPSPVVRSKRKLHASTTELEPHYIHADEPLPIPPATIRPHNMHAHGAIPSPDTLSRRLTALSPRVSRPSSPLGSRPDSAFAQMMLRHDPEAVSPIGKDTANESAEEDDSDTPPLSTESTPLDMADKLRLDVSVELETETDDKVLSPRPIKLNGASFLRQQSETEDEASEYAETSSDASEGDDGVREAIRGVFRLWMASKQKNALNSGKNNGTAGEREFLRIAREAIEE